MLIESDNSAEYAAIYQQDRLFNLALIHELEISKIISKLLEAINFLESPFIVYKLRARSSREIGMITALCDADTTDQLVMLFVDAS